MKQTNKILIVVLCIVAVLFGVVAFAACSERHVCEHVCKICHKCTDKKCNDPVCADKCKGHGNGGVTTHVCKHVCPVCNGCLDKDCKESECAKKCGDGKTAHVLDPLSNYVEKGGICSIMKADDGEKFVGNFASMYQSSLRFTFTSSKDAVATLVLNIGKRALKAVYTDSVMVLLNDDIVESPAEVPVADNGDSWTEFYDLTLGCVNIKEGINTLEIIPTDSDLAKIYNFRNAKLLGDFDAELAPHACSSVCEICGGCKNVFCQQQENCSVKCSCSPYTIFSVIDDEVVVTGNSKNMNEGIVGVTIGKTVTIEFNINVPTAGKYSLKAMFSAGAADTLLSSVYGVTLNGNKIETSATLPVGAMFGDYKDVVLGDYDFVEGKNTIVVESNGTNDSKTWYNIRSIGVGLKGCTYFDDGKQEHVCTHVCEICGKCQDENCTDPICESKCGCPKYTVFSVIDDQVVVVGTSKNTEESNVGVAIGQKVTITFNINVPAAGRYFLKANVSSGDADVSLSSVYGVTLNGSKLETSSLMPVGTLFGDYKDVILGEFDFVEGRNTLIVESNATSDSKTWYNIRSVGVGVQGCTYFDVGHTCTQKCDVCGKCKNASCTETVCTEKCTCKVTIDKVDGTKFGVMDDKVLVDGTTKNGGESVVGVSVNGAVTITFKIHSDKAAKATLMIETSANGAPTKVATEFYVTTVNGIAISGDATLPVGTQFSDYQVTTLAEIDLVEGENTIVFTFTGSMDGSTWYNFKTLILQTEATVTLV